jgi:hypothetical protein
VQLLDKEKNMKKLFFSLLIASFLFGSGVAFAYQDDGYPHRLKDSGATNADPVRVYQLVRNGLSGASTQQMTAGDVVVWDCTSDDGVTVDIMSTTSSSDAVAGVVVSATIPTSDQAVATAVADMGHRNWGYIQIYGLCKIVNVTSGPALAGGAVVASGTTARYATAKAASSTYGTNLGFAYNASEAGQDAVFIRLD